jgi:hypothetical protein
MMVVLLVLHLALRSIQCQEHQLRQQQELLHSQHVLCQQEQSKWPLHWERNTPTVSTELHSRQEQHSVDLLRELTPLLYWIILLDVQVYQHQL